MDEDYQSRPGYKIKGHDLVTEYEERDTLGPVDINPRLHVERNYIDTESNIKIENNQKRSIVDRVFAQERAYKKILASNKEQSEELNEEFDSEARKQVRTNPMQMPLSEQPLQDFRGPAIVPFFPSHW